MLENATTMAWSGPSPLATYNRASSLPDSAPATLGQTSSPSTATFGGGCFRLLVNKRGRNLHARQADRWTSTWFHDQGLYKLMGTIRYPKAA